MTDYKKVFVDTAPFIYFIEKNVNKMRKCEKCEKNIKTIAIFLSFEYTTCNRVARSLLDIGNQAETCAQLFYVKEIFYGFEKAIDL